MKVPKYEIRRGRTFFRDFEPSGESSSIKFFFERENRLLRLYTHIKKEYNKSEVHQQTTSDVLSRSLHNEVLLLEMAFHAFFRVLRRVSVTESNVSGPTGSYPSPTPRSDAMRECMKRCTDTYNATKK